MYFVALATDYDGTLAHHGRVDLETVQAMRRFKATGRRLILVTGRDLPDLKRAFSELELFDRVVAENGALIYDPESEQQRTLGPAPSPLLVKRLRERKVDPLAVGRSIVATWEPNEKTVLEVIQELGLELQIIFNKGAVMILPSGMNKATGLSEALKELEFSFHNVIGVGDAENDHAFLTACGCSAAVANALPTVKETADIKLEKDHGSGVIELMDRICQGEDQLVPVLRQGISIGIDRNGREVVLHPYQGNALISGTSGVGKSTLATALTERMAEKQFEFCVFDPEGDYHDLENAVSIGDVKLPPKPEQAIKLLRDLGANVAINTQNIHVDDRPAFFAKLLPQVTALRAKTARPHWLLIDEAHHLLPASRDDMVQSLPADMPASIFITVHPELMLPDALKTVEVVIAVGPSAANVISSFCDAVDQPAPALECSFQLGRDEVLVWHRRSQQPPVVIKVDLPRQAHKRHTRKYAEGELGEDLSFYFRGPDNQLNLRAQNLFIFLQIAEGLDDRTWEHHLHAGHYSDWFLTVIKDDELADEAADIESNSNLSPGESRARIRDAVHKRYTAPARAREI